MSEGATSAPVDKGDNAQQQHHVFFPSRVLDICVRNHGSSAPSLDLSHMVSNQATFDTSSHGSNDLIDTDDESYK